LAYQGSLITIKVTDEGDFTYDPSVKNLKPRQTVTWTSTQGPFSISFKVRTPFGRLSFQSERADDRNEWFVSTRGVREDVEPGHFHYAVAVVVDDKVFLDADCPEIIVRSTASDD
jgi:hypothetical protein